MTEPEGGRLVETWAAYPWEHPTCEWIRASHVELLCTRCGELLSADDVGAVLETPSQDDAEKVFAAWVEQHERCEMRLPGKAHGADPLLTSSAEGE